MELTRTFESAYPTFNDFNNEVITPIFNMIRVDCPWLNDKNFSWYSFNSIYIAIKNEYLNTPTAYDYESGFLTQKWQNALLAILPTFWKRLMLISPDVLGLMNIKNFFYNYSTNTTTSKSTSTNKSSTIIAPTPASNTVDWDNDKDTGASKTASNDANIGENINENNASNTDFVPFYKRNQNFKVRSYLIELVKCREILELFMWMYDRPTPNRLLFNYYDLFDLNYFNIDLEKQIVSIIAGTTPDETMDDKNYLDFIKFCEVLFGVPIIPIWPVHRLAQLIDSEWYKDDDIPEKVPYVYISFSENINDFDYDIIKNKIEITLNGTRITPTLNRYPNINSYLYFINSEPLYNSDVLTLKYNNITITTDLSHAPDKPIPELNDSYYWNDETIPEKIPYIYIRFDDNISDAIFENIKTNLKIELNGNIIKYDLFNRYPNAISSIYFTTKETLYKTDVMKLTYNNKTINVDMSRAPDKPVPPPPSLPEIKESIYWDDDVISEKVPYIYVSFSDNISDSILWNIRDNLRIELNDIVIKYSIFSRYPNSNNAIYFITTQTLYKTDVMKLTYNNKTIDTDMSKAPDKPVPPPPINLINNAIYKLKVSPTTQYIEAFCNVDIPDDFNDNLSVILNDVNIDKSKLNFSKNCQNKCDDIVIDNTILIYKTDKLEVQYKAQDKVNVDVSAAPDKPIPPPPLPELKEAIYYNDGAIPEKIPYIWVSFINISLSDSDIEDIKNNLKINLNDNIIKYNILNKMSAPYTDIYFTTTETLYKTDVMKLTYNNKTIDVNMSKAPDKPIPPPPRPLPELTSAIYYNDDEIPEKKPYIYVRFINSISNEDFWDIYENMKIELNGNIIYEGINKSPSSTAAVYFTTLQPLYKTDMIKVTYNNKTINVDMRNAPDKPNPPKKG